jgi:hypothetical protein
MRPGSGLVCLPWINARKLPEFVGWQRKNIKSGFRFSPEIWDNKIHLVPFL